MSPVGMRASEPTGDCSRMRVPGQALGSGSGSMTAVTGQVPEPLLVPARSRAQRGCPHPQQGLPEDLSKAWEGERGPDPLTAPLGRELRPKHAHMLAQS